MSHYVAIGATDSYVIGKPPLNSLSFFESQYKIFRVSFRVVSVMFVGIFNREIVLNNILITDILLKAWQASDPDSIAFVG